MNLEHLKKQLIRHEGLRLKPYLCPAGYLTIGIGHNLDVNGISEFICDLIFYEDAAKATDAVRELYPNFEELSDARQRALIDMCFNLGRGGLAGFKKMRAAILAGDFKRAASEMIFSKWAAQVKQRAITLANMMLRGE
jgi:lysozyme